MGTTHSLSFVGGVHSFPLNLLQVSCCGYRAFTCHVSIKSAFENFPIIKRKLREAAFAVFPISGLYGATLHHPCNSLERTIASRHWCAMMPQIYAWSIKRGALCVVLHHLFALSVYQASHSPCASVSFSPLCPPCSGSQEEDTRSRRWCAEAVKKNQQFWNKVPQLCKKNT